MRRSRQVLVAVGGIAMAAVTSVPVWAQPHSTGQAGSSLRAVRIQADNFRFCKASASSCSTTTDTNFKAHAVVGQKIKWIYRDTACDNTYVCPGHNVTFAHRHSGDTQTQGAVIFTTVFHHPGTYRYYCTHHRNQGMTGRIVVTSN